MISMMSLTFQAYLHERMQVADSSKVHNVLKFCQTCEQLDMEGEVVLNLKFEAAHLQLNSVHTVHVSG